MWESHFELRQSPRHLRALRDATPLHTMKHTYVRMPWHRPPHMGYTVTSVHENVMLNNGKYKGQTIKIFAAAVTEVKLRAFFTPGTSRRKTLQSSTPNKFA